MCNNAYPLSTCYASVTDLNYYKGLKHDVHQEISLHLRVYIVADKYLVTDLKDLARQQLELMTSAGWFLYLTEQNKLSLAAEVFATTVDDSSGPDKPSPQVIIIRAVLDSVKMALTCCYCVDDFLSVWDLYAVVVLHTRPLMGLEHTLRSEHSFTVSYRSQAHFEAEERKVIVEAIDRKLSKSLARIANHKSDIPRPLPEHKQVELWIKSTQRLHDRASQASMERLRREGEITESPRLSKRKRRH